jgi:RNA polymerase-binding transcription factor DksA
MSQAKTTFPANILKPIRDHLLEKERQLKRRENELTAEDPFSDVDRLNDNAAVDAEAAEQSGHERIEAMRREADKALVNVRKALTKIKLGKYGLCESCGQMIDTDRLAIDPTVRLCLNCEKRKEASRKNQN